MNTTTTRFPPLGQRWVRDPNEGSGISGRREPAQVEHLKNPQGMRPKKGAWLLEVRSDEGLPAGFCVSLRRILVPTALDKAWAVALDCASALARRFGSELALLYAFEDSNYAQSSRVEAELWKCFSALRLRHLKARVFLRPGPTGEQVKAVANALGADLIVTSSDYHRRFLSCLTHAETGIVRAKGVPCPVVLVKAVVMAKALGTDLSLADGAGVAA
jgi:nucleotide-binding universal stress UspA family protein